MPIAQNAALYTLLGTTFGGDGKVNFALPDFRGRCAVVPNAQGNYPLGKSAGSETVELTALNMPQHNHPFMASSDSAGLNVPTLNALPGNPANSASAPTPMYTADSSQMTTLRNDAIAPAGTGAGHNNMMPSTVVRFCICLIGIFPPRQ